MRPKCLPDGKTNVIKVTSIYHAYEYISCGYVCVDACIHTSKQAGVQADRHGIRAY
jgi:hypothetical protein